MDYELLSNLGLGLATAATATNLLYCLIGVFLGTLIGVLPGLGPTATIAMLLPLTFGLPPVSALIMLSGIYYGSPSTAARPPRSWSTCPANPHRWSPPSTATRWRARAMPARPWRRPRWAPSSPARWPPC